MKRKTLGLLIVAGMLAMIGCEKKSVDLPVQNQSEDLSSNIASSDEVIPGQYIVVLKKSVLKSALPDDASYALKQEEVREIARSLFNKKAGGQPDLVQVYAQTIKGFAVKLAAEDVPGIESQEIVDRVVPDRMFILRPPWENPDPDPEPAGQEEPYGITRVGTASGIGKTAWILDTGIDLDHPDLNVDQTRGMNYIRDKSPDDDNGHGTHCAGIVAAIDNEIGVVGVAAGATVVPVKVLDRRGSGAYSGIIAGIDYVASAASVGDAANMSLGGSAYDPIDDAVEAAASQGIYFALAAGNESTDAATKSPARAEGANIFTISAMDANDNWAYFSNYGNPVDYCEPGVSIYSTYKNGGYTTMSGTSMAAPHMCGILLMTNGKPSASGYVNGDPDGDPDPIGTL